MEWFKKNWIVIVLIIALFGIFRLGYYVGQQDDISYRITTAQKVLDSTELVRISCLDGEDPNGIVYFRLKNIERIVGNSIGKYQKSAIELSSGMCILSPLTPDEIIAEIGKQLK